jgi:methyl-accepting chemotaxis protein
MPLRQLNIGTRLSLGFALILLAACALLAGVLVTSAVNRNTMLGTLAAASERETLVAEMQQHLLKGAVAVRNMGLQTEVAGLQKDEAEAKQQRAAYLAAKQKLETTELAAEDRAPLEQLAKIDAEMNARFAEAVDLAATFNAEQAAAVITQKIDPLLHQANAALAQVVELQKQHAQAATDSASEVVRTTQLASIAAAVLVMLGSAVLAWRITMSITGPLKQAEVVAARVADGDLAFDICVQGKDEAARLLETLERMRASLSSVVSNVRRNSESVATASSEISQGNNDLSSRTEQQASALQQTAASMEELGTTVRHNADNARQANQLAMGAATVASKGGEVVGQVVDTMREINDSSRRIADIVGVIDGIAFQTNILALNAAVEAARAGEQGRGFAVVATEVRNLAQRSAGAAREIKGLIAASVERVERGTSLVDQAGATMTEIVGAIQRVTDIVGEISTASAEQSSGVSQVGTAVTQMDQATQQNAALVEQSAAAAESLKVQAAQLVQAVAVFKVAQAAH